MLERGWGRVRYRGEGEYFPHNVPGMEIIIFGLKVGGGKANPVRQRRMNSGNNG